MTRLFSYIVVSDTGDAPCVDHGLLTLATCKPRIRGAAAVGDWTAGFHSVSAEKGWPEGRLIWLGQVSEILSPGQYQFYHRRRRDAAYRRVSQHEYERLRPDYHNDLHSIRKDLSAPVLVFDPQNTWYFGAGAPLLLPDEYCDFFARGIGHRTVAAASKSFERLLDHMRCFDKSFGRPEHDGPRCVPYDGHGAGPREDKFPYAGEGFSIGPDGRITDIYSFDD